MLTWMSDRFRALVSFDKTQLRAAVIKVAPFYLLKPVSLIINFITISRITSLIGVDGYGSISLILAVAAFVTAVIDFRSNESVVRFRVRYQNEGNPGSANFCVLLGAGIDVGLALLYPLIILTLADPICSHFFSGKIDKELLLIYAVSSAFLFLSGTPSAILQSSSMFWKLSSADLLHKLTRLVWVLLASVPFTVRDVILGYALSNVLYGVILTGSAILTLRREARAFPVTASKVVAKDFITFSGHTFISSLLKAGITDVDKLVLGYFCQTRDVGLYDIVKRVAGLLSWIIFPLGTVTYPTLVKLFHDRLYSDIRNHIRRITLAVAGISLAAVMFILLTKDVILYFFNIVGIPVMNILIPLLISNVLLNCLWYCRVFVNSIGEPQVSVWLNGIMSVLGIFFLLIIVPSAGVVGAALASLCTVFIIFLLWTRYYLSKTRSWSENAQPLTKMPCL